MGKCLFMRKGETHSAPINGILASDLTVGSSVYLNENGSPVEYLVVNQGIPSNSSLYDSSCDGTWLLRKDIYEKRVWDSTNHDYANSDIHAYLNGGFLGVYDAVLQGTIKQVKIPYRAGTGSSTTITSGANGLSAKIFLLSSTEVCFTNANMPSNEGAVLDYCIGFSTTTADSRRIAYLDGATTGWWLRSPYITNNSYVSAVFASGSCGNNGCTNAYGIRPTLILPFNAVFDKNTLILKGVA